MKNIKLFSNASLSFAQNFIFKEVPRGSAGRERADMGLDDLHSPAERRINEGIKEKEVQVAQLPEAEAPKEELPNENLQKIREKLSEMNKELVYSDNSFTLEEAISSFIEKGDFDSSGNANQIFAFPFEGSEKSKKYITISITKTPEGKYVVAVHTALNKLNALNGKDPKTSLRLSGAVDDPYLALQQWKETKEIANRYFEKKRTYEFTLSDEASYAALIADIGSKDPKQKNTWDLTIEDPQGGKDRHLRIWSSYTTVPIKGGKKITIAELYITKENGRNAEKNITYNDLDDVNTFMARIQAALLPDAPADDTWMRNTPALAVAGNDAVISEDLNDIPVITNADAIAFHKGGIDENIERLMKLAVSKRRTAEDFFANPKEYEPLASVGATYTEPVAVFAGPVDRTAPGNRKTVDAYRRMETERDRLVALRVDGAPEKVESYSSKEKFLAFVLSTDFKPNSEVSCEFTNGDGKPVKMVAEKGAGGNIYISRTIGGNAAHIKAFRNGSKPKYLSPEQARAAIEAEFGSVPAAVERDVPTTASTSPYATATPTDAASQEHSATKKETPTPSEKPNLEGITGKEKFKELESDRQSIRNAIISNTNTNRYFKNSDGEFILLRVSKAGDVFKYSIQSLEDAKSKKTPVLKSTKIPFDIADQALAIRNEAQPTEAPQAEAPKKPSEAEKPAPATVESTKETIEAFDFSTDPINQAIDVADALPKLEEGKVIKINYKLNGKAQSIEIRKGNSVGQCLVKINNKQEVETPNPMNAVLSEPGVLKLDISSPENFQTLARNEMTKLNRFDKYHLSLLVKDGNKTRLLRIEKEKGFIKLVDTSTSKEIKKANTEIQIATEFLYDIYPNFPEQINFDKTLSYQNLDEFLNTFKGMRDGRETREVTLNLNMLNPEGKAIKVKVTRHAKNKAGDPFSVSFANEDAIHTDAALQVLFNSPDKVVMKAELKTRDQINEFVKSTQEAFNAYKPQIKYSFRLESPKGKFDLRRVNISAEPQFELVNLESKVSIKINNVNLAAKLNEKLLSSDPRDQAEEKNIDGLNGIENAENAIKTIAPVLKDGKENRLAVIKRGSETLSLRRLRDDRDELTDKYEISYGTDRKEVSGRTNLIAEALKSPFGILRQDFKEANGTKGRKAVDDFGSRLSELETKNTYIKEAKNYSYSISKGDKNFRLVKEKGLYTIEQNGQKPEMTISIEEACEKFKYILYPLTVTERVAKLEAPTVINPDPRVATAIANFEELKKSTTNEAELAKLETALNAIDALNTLINSLKAPTNDTERAQVLAETETFEQWKNENKANVDKAKASDSNVESAIEMMWNERQLEALLTHDYCKNLIGDNYDLKKFQANLEKEINEKKKSPADKIELSGDAKFLGSKEAQQITENRYLDYIKSIYPVNAEIAKRADINEILTEIEVADGINEAVQKLNSINKPTTVLIKGVKMASTEGAIIVRVEPGEKMLSAEVIYHSVYQASEPGSKYEYNANDASSLLEQLNLKDKNNINAEERLLRDSLNENISKSDLKSKLNSDSRKRYTSLRKNFEEYNKNTDNKSLEAETQLFKSQASLVVESVVNEYFFDENGNVKKDVNHFGLKAEDAKAKALANYNGDLRNKFGGKFDEIFDQSFNILNYTNEINERITLAKAYRLFEAGDKEAYATVAEYNNAKKALNETIKNSTWSSVSSDTYLNRQLEAFTPNSEAFKKEAEELKRDYYLRNAVADKTINGSLIANPSIKIENSEAINANQTQINSYIQGADKPNIYDFALASGIEVNGSKSQVEVSEKLQVAFLENVLTEKKASFSSSAEFLTYANEVSDLSSSTSYRQAEAIYQKFGPEASKLFRELIISDSINKLKGAQILPSWNEYISEEYYLFLSPEQRKEVIVPYALKWQESDNKNLQQPNSITFGFGKELNKSGIAEGQRVRFEKEFKNNIAGLSTALSDNPFQEKAFDFDIAEHQDLLKTEFEVSSRTEFLRKTSDLINSKLQSGENISSDLPIQSILTNEKEKIFAQIIVGNGTAQILIRSLITNKSDTISLTESNGIKGAAVDKDILPKQFYATLRNFESAPVNTDVKKEEPKAERPEVDVNAPAPEKPEGEMAGTHIETNRDSLWIYDPRYESSFSFQAAKFEGTKINGESLINGIDSNSPRYKNIIELIKYFEEPLYTEDDMETLKETLTSYGVSLEKNSFDINKYLFPIAGIDGVNGNPDIQIQDLYINEVPSRKIGDVLTASLEYGLNRYREMEREKNAEKNVENEFNLNGTFDKDSKETAHLTVSSDDRGNLRIVPKTTLITEENPYEIFGRELVEGLNLAGKLDGKAKQGYEAHLEYLKKEYAGREDAETLIANHLGQEVARFIIEDGLYSILNGARINSEEELQNALGGNIHINGRILNDRARRFFEEKLRIYEKQKLLESQGILDVEGLSEDRQKELENERHRNERQVQELVRAIYTEQVEAGSEISLRGVDMVTLESYDKEIFVAQGEIVKLRKEPFPLSEENLKLINDYENQIVSALNKKRKILKERLPNADDRIARQAAIMEKSPYLNALREDTSFETKINLINNTYGQVEVPVEIFENFQGYGKQIKEEFERFMPFANYGKDMKEQALLLIDSLDQLPALIAKNNRGSIELDDLIALSFKVLKGNNFFDSFLEKVNPVKQFHKRMQALEDLKKLENEEPKDASYEARVRSLLDKAGIEYKTLTENDKKQISEGKCFIPEASNRYTEANNFLVNAYTLLGVFKRMAQHRSSLASEEIARFESDYQQNSEETTAGSDTPFDYTAYNWGRTYKKGEVSYAPTSYDATLAILRKNIEEKYIKAGISDSNERKIAVSLEFARLLENEALLKIEIAKIDPAATQGMLERMRSDFRDDSERFNAQLEKSKEALLTAIEADTSKTEDQKYAYRRSVENLFRELTEKWTYERYLDLTQKTDVIGGLGAMNDKKLDGITEIANAFTGPYSYTEIVRRNPTELNEKLPSSDSIAISTSAIDSFCNAVATQHGISTANYFRKNPDAILRVISYSQNESQWLKRGNEMWARTYLPIEGDLANSLKGLPAYTQKALHEIGLTRMSYLVLNNIPTDVLENAVKLVSKKDTKKSKYRGSEFELGMPDSRFATIEQENPQEAQRAKMDEVYRGEVDEVNDIETPNDVEITDPTQLTADGEALADFIDGDIDKYNEGLERAFRSIAMDRARYIGLEKQPILAKIEEAKAKIQRLNVDIDQEKINALREEIEEYQAELDAIDTKYESEDPEVELDTIYSLARRYMEIYTDKAGQYRNRAINTLNNQINEKKETIVAIDGEIEPLIQSRESHYENIDTNLFDSKKGASQEMNALDTISAYINLDGNKQEIVKKEITEINNYQSQITKKFEDYDKLSSLIAQNKTKSQEAIRTDDDLSTAIRDKEAEISNLQEKIDTENANGEVKDVDQINIWTKQKGKLERELSVLNEQFNALEKSNQEIRDAKESIARYESMQQGIKTEIYNLYASDQGSIKESINVLNSTLGIEILNTENYNWDKLLIRDNKKFEADKEINRIIKNINIISKYESLVDNGKKYSVRDSILKLNELNGQIAVLNSERNAAEGRISYLQDELVIIKNPETGLENARLMRAYEEEVEANMSIFRDSGEISSIDKINEFFENISSNPNQKDILLAMFEGSSREDFALMQRITRKGADTLRLEQSRLHIIDLICEQYSDSPEVKESLGKIYELANTQGIILSEDQIIEYAKELDKYYEDVRKKAEDPSAQDPEVLFFANFEGEGRDLAEETIKEQNRSLLDLKLAAAKVATCDFAREESISTTEALKESLRNPTITLVLQNYLRTQGETGDFDPEKLSRDWYNYCRVSTANPKEGAKILEESKTLQTLYFLINEPNILTAIFNHARRLPDAKSKETYLGALIPIFNIQYNSSLTQAEFEALSPEEQRRQNRKDMWSNIDIKESLKRTQILYELPKLELRLNDNVSFTLSSTAPSIHGVGLRADGRFNLSPNDTLNISANLGVQFRDAIETVVAPEPNPFKEAARLQAGLGAGIEHNFSKYSSIGLQVNIGMIGRRIGGNARLAGTIDTNNALDGMTVFVKGNTSVLGLGASIGFDRGSLSDAAKRRFDKMSDGSQEFLSTTAQRLEDEITNQILGSKEAIASLDNPEVSAREIAKNIVKQTVEDMIMADENEFQLAMVKKEGAIRFRGVEVGFQNGVPFFKVKFEGCFKTKTYSVYPNGALTRGLLDDVTTRRLNQSNVIVANFGYRVNPEIEKEMAEAQRRGENLFSRAPFPDLRYSDKGRPIVLANERVSVGNELLSSHIEGGLAGYLREYNESIIEADISFEAVNDGPEYQARMNINNAKNSLVEVWIDPAYENLLTQEGPDFFLTFNGITPQITRQTIVYSARNGGKVKHEIITIRFPRITEVTAFDNLTKGIKEEELTDGNKFKADFGNLGAEFRNLEKSKETTNREKINSILNGLNEENLMTTFAKYFELMEIKIAEGEEEFPEAIKARLEEKLNLYLDATNKAEADIAAIENLMKDKYFAALYHLMSVENYVREESMTLAELRKGADHFRLQYRNSDNNTISDVMEVKNGNDINEQTVALDSLAMEGNMQELLASKMKLQASRELGTIHSYQGYVKDTLIYLGVQERFGDIESIPEAKREYILFESLQFDAFNEKLIADQQRYEQEYFEIEKNRPEDLIDAFEKKKEHIEGNFYSKERIMKTIIEAANTPIRLDKGKVTLNEETLQEYVDNLLGKGVYEKLRGTRIFTPILKKTVTTMKEADIYNDILYALILHGAKNKLAQDLETCEFTAEGFQEFLATRKEEFFAQMPLPYRLLIKEQLGTLNEQERIKLNEYEIIFRDFNENEWRDMRTKAAQAAEFWKPSEGLTPVFPIDPELVSELSLSYKDQEKLREITVALVGKKDPHGLEFLTDGLIDIKSILGDTMIDIQELDYENPGNILDSLENCPGLMDQINEAIYNEGLLKDEKDEPRYPTSAEREYLLSYIVYYSLKQITQLIPRKDKDGRVQKAVVENSQIEKSEASFREQYELNDMYERTIDTLKLKNTGGKYTVAGKFLMDIMLNHPEVQAITDEGKRIERAEELSSKILNEITSKLKEDRDIFDKWLANADPEDIERYINLVQDVQVLKLAERPDPLAAENEAAMVALSAFLKDEVGLKVNLFGMIEEQPQFNAMMATSVYNREHRRAGARTLIHTNPRILSKFMFSEDFDEIWRNVNDDDMRMASEACIYFLSPIPESMDLRATRFESMSTSSNEAFNPERNTTARDNIDLLNANITDYLTTNPTPNDYQSLMAMTLALKSDPNIGEILTQYEGGKLLGKSVNEIIFTYLMEKFNVNLDNTDAIREQYQFEAYGFETFNSPLGLKLSTSYSNFDFLSYFLPEEAETLANLEDLRKAFYQPNLNEKDYRLNLDRTFADMDPKKITEYIKALDRFKEILEMYRALEFANNADAIREEEKGWDPICEGFRANRIQAKVQRDDGTLYDETLIRVQDTERKYEYYLKPQATGGFVILGPCTNLSTKVEEGGEIFFKPVGLNVVMGEFNGQGATAHLGYTRAAGTDSKTAEIGLGLGAINPIFQEEEIREAPTGMEGEICLPGTKNPLGNTNGNSSGGDTPPTDTNNGGPTNQH